MDDRPIPISPSDLYGRLGTASAPVLLDVRRQDAFVADDRLIAGAIHRAPADVEHWRLDLPPGRPVVAYCADAGTASRSVASALRDAGIDATYLEGGISGWKNLALPTRQRTGVVESKWVTREHPKIDRIACPWLSSIRWHSSFTCHPTKCLRSQRRKKLLHTTSRAPSSGTSAIAARSTRSY